MNKLSRVVAGSVLLAAIATLTLPSARVNAQASTTNLYDGHVYLPSGGTLYHSSTEIDRKLGISTDGNVVTEKGVTPK